MTEMPIPWDAGAWTHPPAAVAREGDALRVTAVEGSDAWRHTSYGFVHDSEHALVAPFARGTAMEVEFEADLAQQFDQAGVFVRASDEQWIKAGVEFADGFLQVGAVVTDGASDWSVAPLLGRESTRIRMRVRASWEGDAITLRAGQAGEPLRLVRLLPWRAPDAVAGPFVCAPSRAGLSVDFLSWRVTSPDATLH